MRKLAILCLVLIVAACEKEELPANQTGTPVFVSDVNFNGGDYTLSAGENGLVLNPTFTTTDTSIQFTSTLSNPACTNCGPALNLEINSPDSFVLENDTDWLTQLESWMYALEPQPGDSLHTLNLSIDNGNNISEGDWFVNGALVNAQPAGTIDLSIGEPGTYDINYQDNDSTCTTGTSLIIDYNGEDIPCYGNLYQSVVDSNTIIAEPGPAFDPDATAVVWIVNGETAPAGDPLSIVVDIDNVFEVCAVMIDAFGCQDSVCFIPTNSATMCANNLRINSSEITSVDEAPNTEALVKIEFVDNNGVAYTSEGTQTNSNIQLVSIAPYTEPTRPGESFAKLGFEISCTLYNEGGQGFPFSGTINSAVALP
ncbi:MAG TPA: hypothetical protein VJ911_05260 [Cryomorphaceae bacterium]|nr:hypothetical protein [Cryomorphaceae bacterium]